jgi:hypothetical protein
MNDGPEGVVIPDWNANWQSDPIRRDNPINRHPPRRFPFLSELMRDASVLDQINRAWRDTNADVRPIIMASEQGGWIYMDMTTGRLTFRRKDNPLGPPTTDGTNQRGYLTIDLNNPPTVAGSVVIANFHTHPSDPFTGASDPDRQLNSGYGVPGIVRGQGGAYSMTGTPKRIGNFNNALQYPGYPPRNQWG